MFNIGDIIKPRYNGLTFPMHDWSRNVSVGRQHTLTLIENNVNINIFTAAINSTTVKILLKPNDIIGYFEVQKKKGHLLTKIFS